MAFGHQGTLKQIRPAAGMRSAESGAAKPAPGAMLFPRFSSQRQLDSAVEV